MAYVVDAIWTANDGSEQPVLDALRELAPLSREEPGNLYYPRSACSRVASARST